MRASGLAHLTAVSGANVAIVVGAVFFLARAAGTPRKWAIGAACISVVGFAVLVRFEPSVLRASVMALIGLMALFLGRPRIPSVALITAVTVLLLFDPLLALSWGFALSVSATAGIVWFVPALVAQVQERWPQAPKYLVLALALAISAQVATAPLVAVLGNNSLIVGVPANLLAMPVVPFITLGGLLVTFVAPVTPGLASVLANLVSPMADWVGFVARTGAQSWLASIPWPSGPEGAAVTTGLIVATVLLAVAIKSRRLTRFGARALAAALVVATALVVVFFSEALDWRRPFGLASWPPRDWQVAACDVGQGDGLVFRLTQDSALVSDVGSDPEAITRCLAQA
jgi:competence protein ComEC